MSDRIERDIFIKAPRGRVWRAIADRSEFGAWFRVSLPPGPFVAGENVRGNMTHPGYEHAVMEMDVVEVSPEHTLSYRWHPYAVDPSVDYSQEPTTLVTFRLEEADGGTRLTVTESGFDGIPAHRRDEAFRMNEHGWAAQLGNIERHVAANG
jgi:uncharacterized protein YndB with AHSA1/START domain